MLRGVLEWMPKLFYIWSGKEIQGQHWSPSQIGGWVCDSEVGAPWSWENETLSHEPCQIVRSTNNLHYAEDLDRAKVAGWDKKNGYFWVINAHHDVFASKVLQNEPIVAGRKETLRTWHAFVVWSKTLAKVVKILEYYNHANHLS